MRTIYKTGKMTPLPKLNRFDLLTIPRAEARLHYLQALYQFFLLLQRSLEEKKDSLLKQISSNYPTIREKLSHLSSPSDSGIQKSFAEKLG